MDAFASLVLGATGAPNVVRGCEAPGAAVEQHDRKGFGLP